MTRGSGETTEQIIQAMLSVRERDRIYYVCPISVDHYVQLFHRILSWNNPNYARRLNATTFAIPHKDAIFEFVSSGRSVNLALAIIPPVRVVIDHGCRGSDPIGHRNWSRLANFLNRYN